jgi:uncharacterized protein YraI
LRCGEAFQMSARCLLKVTVALVALVGTGLANSANAATARASDPITIFAGPGAFYPPIGRLMRNEVVSLAECTPRGTWCKIIHHGPDGWVLGSYLIGAAAKVDATPWHPLGSPSFLSPFPHHFQR